MTTVFIPVSTGPWINIPAGATNLPVTSAAGFEIGQKIGIDIGGNYEVATVTAVGKAATQTTFAAAAVAGATNIKVAANANMTAGDTLTVGTGARKELVKVANVGAAGATGTGVDLASPLKFDHAASIDVWSAGTGITFQPATKFPHLSGDAVQALGAGITLDSPLAKVHPYGAPVVNSLVTAAGYQGPPAPTQWFGGALSPSAGSIALLDAGGVAVVDAMVYGSQQSNSSANGYIVSPELATLEGEQGQGGCIVVVPGGGGGGGFGQAASAGGVNRSFGRFPNGADADNLCRDFRSQASTTLPAASAAGATNIKAASVADLRAGQSIVIDSAANQETAVIATVGTAGAATVGTDIAAAATVIPVSGGGGFTAGQTITIDSGANYETAVVASATGGGRGGRGGPAGAGATVTVTAPLKFAHAVGAQVSGTGITLTAALTKAHASGAQVASSVPTPGAPNKY
jgi:hypothetical protein